MPSLELTVEDTSPTITYSSGWSTGMSVDAALDLYSQSSFMVTQSSGQFAAFSFNGTGVQIYGAKRSNHGPFHVNLDSSSNIGLNGTTSPDIFQTLLYSATGLQQGPHQVTITNDAAAYLDIDFITWQTDIGNANDNIIVKMFKDTDPSFMYSGSSTWTTKPINVGSFSGGSGHAANSSLASFIYTFKGVGVSLYGPVGPAGSTYTVRLDGGAWSVYSSAKQFYRPQMLLYHANNLLPGTHSIHFQCQPSSSTQQCAIDYANVYVTSSLNPQSQLSLSGHTMGGLNVATLIGITAACVAAFFLLVGLLGFLWFRYRRGSQDTGSGSGRLSRTSSSGRHGSQMTTIPNPFYLTAPPPAAFYGESDPPTPRKGQATSSCRERPQDVSESNVQVFPMESPMFPGSSTNSMLVSMRQNSTVGVPLASTVAVDVLPPGYSA